MRGRVEGGSDCWPGGPHRVRESVDGGSGNWLEGV